MHDSHHIGAGAVNLAVDEALQVGAAIIVGARPVQVEAHDVAACNKGRRHAAGQPEVAGMRRVAHAYVAESVYHTLLIQDVVGVHEIRQDVIFVRPRGHCITIGI